MSLDIKGVIRVARGYFVDLLPEFPAKSDDVRLEEIERDGSNWAVTFSVPASSYETLHEAIESGLLGPYGRRRVAKVIIVDGTDGQLIALKQRAA
jgi:hypothetical protein